MADADTLTVRFRQTAKILLRGQWALHARRIRIVGLLMITSTGIAVVAEWGKNDSALMLGLLGIGWLLVAHAYVLRPWLTYRAFLKEPNMAGELALTFGHECVRAENGTVNSRYDWSAFTKCIEGRDLFVLRLGKKHILVVPKSAFVSNEDMERFREIVASKVATAR